MLFKKATLQREYDCLPLLLILVLEEFERASLEIAKIDPVITRIFEKIPGDTDVHSEMRAADIRDEIDGKFTYTADQRDYIIDRINRRFPRSDEKKTVIWHSFDKGPMHFHLQISFSTKVYQGMLNPRMP